MNADWSMVKPSRQNNINPRWSKRCFYWLKLTSGGYYGWLHNVPRSEYVTMYSERDHFVDYVIGKIKNVEKGMIHWFPPNGDYANRFLRP